MKRKLLPAGDQGRRMTFPFTATKTEQKIKWLWFSFSILIYSFDYLQYKVQLCSFHLHPDFTSGQLSTKWEFRLMGSEIVN
jgi:hypothetical protein